MSATSGYGANPVAVGTPADTGRAAPGRTPSATRSRWSRIGEKLRSRGFEWVVHKVFDTVPAWLVHYDALGVVEMTELAVTAAVPDGFSVGTLDAAEIDRFAAVFPRTGAESYESRLGQGQSAVTCDYDGVPCGMAWLDCAGQHIDQEKFCVFALPGDAAWGYDVIVAGEWQGQGLAKLLLCKHFEHALERGYRRVIGYAGWSNRPSLRAMEAVGYRRIRKVTLVNVLGFRIHRVRDLGTGAASYTRVGFRRNPRLFIAPGRPASSSTAEPQT